MSFHVFYYRKINGTFYIIDFGVMVKSHWVSLIYNRFFLTFLKCEKLLELQNTPDPKISHEVLWICPFQFAQAFRGSSLHTISTLLPPILTPAFSVETTLAKVISNFHDDTSNRHFLFLFFFDLWAPFDSVTHSLCSDILFLWDSLTLFLALLLTHWILFSLLSRLLLYYPLKVVFFILFFYYHFTFLKHEYSVLTHGLSFE